MAQTTILQGRRLAAARHDERIAIVRFSNPPTGTMDDATEVELEQLLDAIEADERLRVVVLTGADPGVFIRHYDVRVLEQRGRALAARGLRFSTDRPVPEAPIHRCLRRIERGGRIFIAGINGAAMGGGYELALACDLRIAQDGDYRIGLPETNIGLLPGAGGTQRLARLVGPSRALEWILTGRTFPPREAAALGLVNECCPQPVLDRCVQLAEDLAARHPAALSHVKRLVRGAASGGLDAGLADERTLFCDLMTSERSIELMAKMNADGEPITGRR